MLCSLSLIYTLILIMHTKFKIGLQVNFGTRPSPLISTQIVQRPLSFTAWLQGQRSSTLITCTFSLPNLPPADWGYENHIPMGFFFTPVGCKVHHSCPVAVHREIGASGHGSVGHAAAAQTTVTALKKMAYARFPRSLLWHVLRGDRQGVGDRKNTGGGGFSMDGTDITNGRALINRGDRTVWRLPLKIYKGLFMEWCWASLSLSPEMRWKLKGSFI